MDFTIKQLTEITGAEILKSDIEENMRFVISTDTRNINKKNVFIPIIGERFDGHDFIENALNSGCLGYFTQKDIVNNSAKFILKVENTLEAYLKLANFYKRKVNPKTVAITGSAGKTTTKEMAYSVFSQKFKTHKSELNHNNEIGLAQTIFSMPEDTEVLIVEMGMRGLGEIELLSKYAEPDIAIITNIGSAHIGRLGSVENIAKAKFEITKFLKPDGILIANESPYLDKINNIKDRTIDFSLKAKALKISDLNEESSVFIYKGNKYKINISGEYNIHNALGVIEAAQYSEMTPSQIAKGLMNFKPIENRWQIEKVYGANIINDAYNANPESMAATIKNFVSVYNGRKILVLGDMGELGEDEVKIHRKLGEEISDFKYDILLTIGNLSKNISDVDTSRSIHYQTVEGGLYYLRNNLRKNDWVLLKASRAMKFETILDQLKEFEKIENLTREIGV